MDADPKSPKKTDGLTVFLVPLGSARVKAAYKILVKSTLCVNPIKSIQKITKNFHPMIS